MYTLTYKTNDSFEINNGVYQLLIDNEELAIESFENKVEFWDEIEWMTLEGPNVSKDFVR